MKCLILGGTGFIGCNLAKKLKDEGHYVVVADVQDNKFMQPEEYCNELFEADLRDRRVVSHLMDHCKEYDECYQLAALMGGAGFIFTGENDADIIHNSALINLHVASEAVAKGIKKVFYSSSACIYNQDLQLDSANGGLKEGTAWPLNPDSDYGIEKGFSEKVYQAFAKNHGLNIRIGRFHNIFGPYSDYTEPKCKAPAAICRKVAEAMDGGEIEIWGDGLQTRSFTCIEDCLEGVSQLMDSDYTKPINIGSSEMITINDLAKMVIDISGKSIKIKNINGPQGVRGRNSDNTLCKSVLNGWEPRTPLKEGIAKLYEWVEAEINK